jgi:hypothetical protein
METTIVNLRPDTMALLERYREYPSESYDDIIRKVLFMVERRPPTPPFVEGPKGYSDPGDIEYPGKGF